MKVFVERLPPLVEKPQYKRLWRQNMKYERGDPYDAKESSVFGKVTTNLDPIDNLLYNSILP
jgi:hypothetical protein